MRERAFEHRWGTFDRTWITGMKATLRAEKQLARELALHFAELAEDVATRAEEVEIPTRADALHLYDPEAARAELDRITRANLYKVAQVTAQQTIKHIEKELAKDKLARMYFFKQGEDGEDGDTDEAGAVFDEATEEDFAFAADFPPAAGDLVTLYVEGLIGQSWWQGISAATGEVIGDILERSTSGKEAAEAIRAELGGNAAIQRGKTIAVAEITGAANAGRSAAATTYTDNGVIGALSFSKRWGTVLDERVRNAHALLEGITIPMDGNFDVGGYPAPWPAHWSLPAALRINCRCVLSIIVN